MAPLYSFIIVDDEPEIREGIRDTISWEELGFSFAGDCGNGFEALELAERILPDAALVDINMPFMDGLAFTDRLREISPLTRVLVISGYDDFEYARRAMRLSVYDYIVKPVTPGELRAVLEKLRATLDAERTERLNLELIKKQLAESLPMLRERFLARLAGGKLPAGDGTGERLRERLAYFSLPIPHEGAAYQCLALDQLSHTEPSRENESMTGEHFDIDLLTRRNILEEIMSREAGPVEGIPFRDDADRLVILLWGKGMSCAGVYRAGLKAAEGICRELAALGFRDTAAGVGEAVEHIEGIGVSCETASEALAAALLRGEAGAGAWRELMGKRGKQDSRACDQNQKWGPKIVSALKTGGRDEAVRCVEDMMDYFRQAPFTPGEYRLKCALVLAAVMQGLEDMDVPAEEIFPHSQDPFGELRGITKLDDIRAWLTDLVRTVCGYTAARRDNFARVKVREALEYIETNYGDPDLSLQGLCRKLDISSSYFSACLKKHHDRSFVDELTAVRMTKAMELLQTTDLLTYEIASRIGFRDAHYFSLSFRKFAGVTCTEYRNRSVYAAE
ncbi:MAG: response regulator [Treponema sp.]|jgi:two-component system response regulator YesN|nr:response regulator [Treponema sp.]